MSTVKVWPSLLSWHNDETPSSVSNVLEAVPSELGGYAIRFEASVLVLPSQAVIQVMEEG